MKNYTGYRVKGRNVKDIRLRVRNVTERYGTLRNATERYGTLDETRNVELYIYQTRLIARSVDRKKNCNTFKGIYYIYIYIITN